MARIFATQMDVLPEELGSIKAGSQWCWEPLKIENRCYLEVVYVEQKFGGAWWILSRALRDGNGKRKGEPVWNELSRFIEAAVLTRSAS